MTTITAQAVAAAVEPYGAEIDSLGNQLIIRAGEVDKPWTRTDAQAELNRLGVRKYETAHGWIVDLDLWAVRA